MTKKAVVMVIKMAMIWRGEADNKGKIANEPKKWWCVFLFSLFVKFTYNPDFSVASI